MKTVNIPMSVPLKKTMIFMSAKKCSEILWGFQKEL